jgi:L-fuconolactonase
MMPSLYDPGSKPYPDVDAHQHFWPTGVRVPLPGAEVLDRAFLPKDLHEAARSTNVSATVLVQCTDNSAENDRLARFVATAAMVRAVVCWLPLHDPPATHRELERVRELGVPVAGARQGLSPLLDGDALSAASELALRELALRKLTWDVTVTSELQREIVLSVARRIPELKIIANHLGRPPVDSGKWNPWARQIKKISRFPNVAIKISAGLDLLRSWAWNPAHLTSYVSHVVECFGPERCLLASNWPVSTLAGSYRTIWCESGSILKSAGLNEAELAWVHGGSAREWYRF